MQEINYSKKNCKNGFSLPDFTPFTKRSASEFKLRCVFSCFLITEVQSYNFTLNDMLLKKFHFYF